jgi:hypothetical protein
MYRACALAISYIGHFLPIIFMRHLHACEWIIWLASLLQTTARLMLKGELQSSANPPV